MDFSNLRSFGWIVLLVIGLLVLLGALFWERGRRKRATAARHAEWKVHHDWLRGKTPSPPGDGDKP